MEYALNFERENSPKHAAVILPELAERQRYYLPLHNNRSSGNEGARKSSESDQSFRHDGIDLQDDQF
jgi:hypothetical protein